MKNKEVLEVEAYIYNIHIGTLILYNSKIYFNYTPKFKYSNIQISPLKLDIYSIDEIYINTDSKIYQGMPGIFFDSLPDKFGMSFINRYFESKGYSIKDITLLDRLSFIGNRGMGAIEYKPKLEQEDTKEINQVLIARELWENMQNILFNKQEIYSIKDLMQILPNASPLGGGRPKLLISFNKTTKEIKTNNKNLDIGFTRHIIKFDEAYYENESIELTKFEYIYMKMAQDCGINIPDITLYPESELNHLIVERFDRDKNDNKIHIATAASLLHKDINIPQVMSYEELFVATNKICQKQSSVEQQFKRMLFNTLMFNVDDHAKNFSFIMEQNGEWDLTPAYDITYSYGMTKEHLTTINGKSRDFILEDYLDIAKKNLISEQFVLKILKDMLNICKDFINRAKEINLSENNINQCLFNINPQLNIIEEELYLKLNIA